VINHYNYWSPLACQVEEQEEPETPTHKKENLSVILPGPSNKIAAHWARKITNRKARTGILDTGATSGAGRPEDAELFENTGQPSTKVLMLPDKSKVRATHKMLLKHKIRDGAREMNIVPGLHPTLVSVPKMVDKDYIVVFDKKSARTYDATTTTISATEQPVLEPPDAHQQTSGSCHSMRTEARKMTAAITAILKENIPAILEEHQRKQTPSSNSQAPARQSCITTHRQASPSKKLSSMQSEQETMPHGQA